MLDEIENPAEALRIYNEETYGSEEDEVRKMRLELAANEENELRKKQLEARVQEVQQMVDGFRSIPSLQVVSEDTAATIALFVSQIGNEIVAPRRGNWGSTQTWMMFLAPRHWVRAITETAMYNIVKGVSARYLEWREWKNK